MHAWGGLEGIPYFGGLIIRFAKLLTNYGDC